MARIQAINGYKTAFMGHSAGLVAARRPCVGFSDYKVMGSCMFAAGYFRNSQNTRGLSSGRHEAGDMVNSSESLPLMQDLGSDSNSSRIKRLYSQAKLAVRTYKTGISNVWKNQRQVMALRRQYNFKTVAELEQKVLNEGWVQKLELGNEIANGKMVPSTSSHMTRREYLLTYRTGKDFYKLPLFSVIFIICFEMTPFVLLLFPRIAPSTCTIQEAKVIRSRNQAIEQWKRQRQQEFMNTIEIEKQKPDSLQLQTASVYKLHEKHLAQLFTILTPGVLPTGWYTTKYIQTRLAEYVVHIKCDDLLLSRFNGSQNLDHRELIYACQERVIDTANKTDDQLREHLSNWIEQFSQTGMDVGFFLCK